MIEQYQNQYYVSLYNVTQTVQKTSAWFYKCAEPSRGIKLRIESESPQPRIYFTLNETVNALMNSVMKGDLSSYTLLGELKTEAKMKGIAIGLDELEMINLRSHLDNWLDSFGKPREIERDKARVEFNNWICMATGKAFDINRNFFAVLLKDAVERGKIQYKKQIRRIRQNSMRVYKFSA